MRTYSGCRHIHRPIDSDLHIVLVARNDVAQLSFRKLASTDNCQESEQTSISKAQRGPYL